jgi:sulfite reductase (NADPH) flavoprotein alpha-component
MQADGEEIIIDPRSQVPMTLAQFLSTKANLSRLTSSFLKLFYAYEKEHDKKNKLGHLLQQDNRSVLTEFLSAHDPLFLLKEYQGLQTPLQELCAQFGPLLPRFYSVASSLHAHPESVDLLVALFTFTHAGEQRFGVASHFLCHLAQEHLTKVPVYVQPAHGFALPEDKDAPIIMIGPGTGVAPFRAFLQERMSLGAKGKNWLFFGERNQKTDYFYQDFFSPLAERGFLQLDLAFSRDQAQKIYVQHRMYEKRKQFWAWLQEGAYLFVCGDAHHMAKDVETALQQIIQEEGSLSDENAKAYVKSLRAQKRYLTDVY